MNHLLFLLWSLELYLQIELVVTIVDFNIIAANKLTMACIAVVVSTTAVDFGGC